MSNIQYILQYLNTGLPFASDERILGTVARMVEVYNVKYALRV